MALQKTKWKKWGGGGEKKALVHHFSLIPQMQVYAYLRDVSHKRVFSSPGPRDELARPAVIKADRRGRYQVAVVVITTLYLGLCSDAVAIRGRI